MALRDGCPYCGVSLGHECGCPADSMGDILGAAMRAEIDRSLGEVMLTGTSVLRKSGARENLTAEKVAALAAALPAVPPSFLMQSLIGLGERPFSGRIAGMDVFVEPSPPRRVEVRDIKHADGTSILGADFLAAINAELEAMFGRREPLCTPGVAYVLGGQHLVMNSLDAHRMRSIINWSAF